MQQKKKQEHNKQGVLCACVRVCRGACGGLRARGMHAASARGACSAGEDLDHEEHDPYEDQEEECFTQGPVYVTAETDAHDDVHGMRVSRTSSRVHGLGFRV